MSTDRFWKIRSRCNDWPYRCPACRRSWSAFVGECWSSCRVLSLKNSCSARHVRERLPKTFRGCARRILPLANWFWRWPLTHGSGQWIVHASANRRAGLPLGNFNLALANVHWANGGDTVVGLLDGKNLALWVEKPGEVLFDWTLRGVPVTGGLKFILSVPPCTSGVLEIKIAADQHIVIGKNCGLLSGPLQTDQASKRIWRIEFSGRGPIEFQVRRPVESPRRAPLLLAQLQVKQEVRPDRLSHDYDFQVEALHGPVEELTFACDPSLQPFDVSCRTIAFRDWDFKQAPASAASAEQNGTVAMKSSVLVVHLREPFQGKLQGLTIRCLSPYPAGKNWRSPALRLQGAQLRGESLALVVHPDVQLEEWHNGGFRLDSSLTETDGTQVLTLVDPAPGFASSSRPSCRFKSGGCDVAATHNTWWRIGPKESVLTTDVAYEVQRGSLFQLALKLPTPAKLWRVEGVDFEPKDALRSWEASGPLLIVDLLRGLTPRNPGKLSVRLVHHREDSALQTRLIDVPTLEPMDATTIRGATAVSVDSSYQAALEQTTATPATPPDDGPWRAQGGAPPLFLFARLSARRLPPVGSGFGSGRRVFRWVARRN